MNKSMIAVILLVCGAALSAQGPAGNNKPAQPAAAPAPAAQPQQPAAQPKKAVKSSDQDAEESVVMIDSKADAEDMGSPEVYGSERDEAAVPGGLPSSYGQCKGVISEGGRNILVFENPDDGAISFIQITVGKAKVSWKLVDRLPRSAD